MSNTKPVPTPAPSNPKRALLIAKVQKKYPHLNAEQAWRRIMTHCTAEAAERERQRVQLDAEAQQLIADSQRDLARADAELADFHRRHAPVIDLEDGGPLISASDLVGIQEQAAKEARKGDTQAAQALATANRIAREHGMAEVSI